MLAAWTIETIGAAILFVLCFRRRNVFQAIGTEMRVNFVADAKTTPQLQAVPTEK